MANHPNRSANRPSLEENLLGLLDEIEHRANSLPSGIADEYEAEYTKLIEALDAALNAAAAFAPAFKKAGFAKL